MTKKASENETKLIEQIATLTADLQRVRADFENYRKQVDIQKKQLAEMVEFATIEKALPLMDTIELAILHNEALAPLEKTLDKTLSDLGLTRIEASAGTKFDPNYHEATQMDDADGEEEVISEVLRGGYLYHGEVLRPAMVTVTKQ